MLYRHGWNWLDRQIHENKIFATFSSFFILRQTMLWHSLCNQKHLPYFFCLHILLTFGKLIFLYFACRLSGCISTLPSSRICPFLNCPACILVLHRQTPSCWSHNKIPHIAFEPSQLNFCIVLEAQKLLILPPHFVSLSYMKQSSIRERLGTSYLFYYWWNGVYYAQS